MLTSLAVVEVNKATIGAYPYAIRALVSLLRDGKVERRKRRLRRFTPSVCSRIIGAGPWNVGRCRF
ncbi:U-box domain-containing protein 8 [Prunus yedoensis var. nudiflora]|uniref:U-box domain-containing protein 8 n=1 Tax=Prunus yedoensis var. nudiflora TaxID=2094558 RepID=A0A314YRT6_PRUYE|nr:U-box domain-containing protein 8 [Prunus yedoensis var. nudiflora]